jgi:small subunit ribosomal protein S3
MKEKEFIKQNLIHMRIKESLEEKTGKAAEIGDITLEKTPLGEKIIISTTRPGLIIGRGGAMIKELTKELKQKFKLENPHIETAEISNPHTSAQVVATKFAKELERFGPSRFKGIGYRELTRIMAAGAYGVEIVVDGPIPGARSKKWRFYDGYMKKCGFISDNLLDKAHCDAVLKKGTVGITVTIMHPDTPLPDKIDIVEATKSEPEVVEEVVEEKKEEKPKAEKKEEKPKAEKKEEKPKAEKKESKSTKKESKTKESKE